MTPSTLRAALCAAAAFFLLGNEPAQAQIPCGTTLTQSVRLQADVVCGTGQNGLLVGADNVTIDLNGFTLLGPWHWFHQPWGGAVGIVSQGFNGVTIVGGAIKGFSQPIVLGGGKGHFIGKVYAADDHGDPVSLFGIAFSVIENNDFRSIDLGYSTFSPSFGNSIRGNRLGTAPGGGGGSIRLSGCGVYENQVQDNDIRADAGQFQPVITVSQGAHGNDFTGNRVRGSVEFRGTYNQFRKNEVSAEPGASFAMLVYGTLRGNQFLCPYDEGMGNTIIDNVFVGGFSGVRLQADPGSLLLARENRITGNRFASQGVSGIFFTVTAESNDARGNTYQRVPHRVIDHGRGNDWP